MSIRIKFRTYFIAGLVVLAPFLAATFIITRLFVMADAFIVDPLFRLLPLEIEMSFKVVLTKLLIAAVVILFVTFVGYATRKFLVGNLFNFGESVLKSIPVFNRIYLFLKDIAQAFFDNKKGAFKRVVFVEFPRKGIYALGFVTQEKPWELSRVTGREIVNVFIPKPPNPAGGYLVLIPREDLIESSLTVEEGIKLIISGGAAVPALE